MRGFIALASLALAACGGGKPDTDATAAAGFEPPATRAVAPIAGQAQAQSLLAYVGHYPDDPVGGVNFFDRTEVATALDQAVTDVALRRAVVRSDGPRTPIFRVGSRIASRGCEAHDCGNHNWTLLVDPTTGKGELCVHDGGRTLWRAGGPPERRTDDCPAEPKGA